jgi:hypothetical protein
VLSGGGGGGGDCVRDFVGDGRNMRPLFLVEKVVFSNLLLLLKSMKIFSVSLGSVSGLVREFLEFLRPLNEKPDDLAVVVVAWPGDMTTCSGNVASVT